ncbi:hypothetical protein F5883DRAFT_531847 [Diaporthe sp. PMI_573]|nr:hypothetical protein F5883DRAFT_531847 [Diaporthaceae sp. PMI_573]
MGVAVGIPLTALLLVVGVIWAIRERRWRLKYQQMQRHELRKEHEHQPPSFEPSGSGISEVPAIRRPAELESRDH